MSMDICARRGALYRATAGNKNTPRRSKMRRIVKRPIGLSRLREQQVIEGDILQGWKIGESFRNAAGVLSWRLSCASNHIIERSHAEISYGANLPTSCPTCDQQYAELQAAERREARKNLIEVESVLRAERWESNKRCPPVGLAATTGTRTLTFPAEQVAPAEQEGKQGDNNAKI